MRTVNQNQIAPHDHECGCPSAPERALSLDQVSRYLGFEPEVSYVKMPRRYLGSDKAFGYYGIYLGHTPPYTPEVVRDEYGAYNLVFWINGPS